MLMAEALPHYGSSSRRSSSRRACWRPGWTDTLIVSRRLLLGAAVVLAGSGSYLLGRSTPKKGAIVDPDAYAAKLGRQQGLMIGFGDPSTFYLPPYLPADAPVETGFLSAYGAKTSENDFNTYAEIVFSDPQRLIKLAESVPIIAKNSR